jgi:hypothetical protein
MGKGSGDECRSPLLVPVGEPAPAGHSTPGEGISRVVDEAEGVVRFRTRHGGEVRAHSDGLVSWTEGELARPRDVQQLAEALRLASEEIELGIHRNWTHPKGRLHPRYFSLYRARIEASEAIVDACRADAMRWLSKDDDIAPYLDWLRLADLRCVRVDVWADLGDEDITLYADATFELPADVSVREQPGSLEHDEIVAVMGDALTAGL